MSSRAATKFMETTFSGTGVGELSTGSHATIHPFHASIFFSFIFALRLCFFFNICLGQPASCRI